MMTTRQELAGKRLLLLGGSLWKDAVADFCHENGIVMVAAGNDPTSGICDIADEYCNEDTTDSMAMKALIRQKRIDGVYLGGNEPVIVAASQYVNELGLPCYCTKPQWNALQDKKQFKELCSRFGLPVARELNPSSIEGGDFPVVTKPADGCGSRGFSVCHNAKDLEKGLAVATAVSPTGRAIVEEYVPNEAVGVVYTLSGGKLLFSTIEDKYPVLFNPYGTYVGGLYDFESSLAKEFRMHFENKIQKMVHFLKLRESSFWIEVFHHNGRYYFNEAGFRVGGSGTIYPVAYFSGINQVAADIYFSLTGKSKLYGFSPIFGDTVPHKKKYAVYPLFARAGTIGSISGQDTLLALSNVLTVLSGKKAGNSIPDNGSFNHVAALVHFVYDDVNELKDTIHAIHERVKVKDCHGQNMVMRLFDIDHFVPNQ